MSQSSIVSSKRKRKHEKELFNKRASFTNLVSSASLILPPEVDTVVITKDKFVVEWIQNPDTITKNSPNSSETVTPNNIIKKINEEKRMLINSQINDAETSLSSAQIESYSEITKKSLKKTASKKSVNEKLNSSIRAINESLQYFHYLPPKDVPVRDKKINLNRYEWSAKICEYLKLKAEDEHDEKLEEWGNLATKKEHHISTIDSVYDKPNTSYFEQYVDYIATEHEEVPDYLIPLNPPPAPMLIQDKHDANFMRHFEAATDYILYAATACTRLRVSEKIARRSRLRWRVPNSGSLFQFALKEDDDNYEKSEDHENNEEEDDNEDGKAPDGDAAQAPVEDNGGNHDDDEDDDEMDIDRKKDSDYEKSEDHENNEKEDDNEDGDAAPAPDAAPEMASS
ncbi:hypothetical protein RCL_jg38.t1 [Rhizophagus clarus]|uniref:Uncharacterized protein n=1 Tax=Rhizophagus clarus TaxID=94130 RepID=A0A8H3M455_9GLOM|nr:hypothetical protein RCL_jg38.t1 [Rhizophagus clarus]